MTRATCGSDAFYTLRTSRALPFVAALNLDQGALLELRLHSQRSRSLNLRTHRANRGCVILRTEDA